MVDKYTPEILSGKQPKSLETNKHDLIDEGEEASLEEQTAINIAYRKLYEHIQDKFTVAKNDRRITEHVWLKSLRAWRGIYSSEELAKIEEARSRNPYSSGVFIKLTKTKTNAAKGQIFEILYGSSEFPISIEATPVPEGIAETVHLDPANAFADMPEDPYGYNGDGQTIEPGATRHSLLRGLSDKFKKLVGQTPVSSGPSPDKAKMPEHYPAAEAALKMHRKIQDQIAENDVELAMRCLTNELVILGTGVLKGPFNEQLEEPFWDLEDGVITYKPKVKLRPTLTNVSVWNCYPDPSASSMNNCEWFIERHLLSRSQVLKLKRQPYFRAEALDTIIEQNPTDIKEYWEVELQDNSHITDRRKYEILEYWGYIDRELAETLELDLGDILETTDLVQINAWISNGQILRVLLNPFQPQRIPYYVVPMEEHPYQLWGIGVPENMSDSQEIMNGHYRMAIDNLNYAGSCILEVNRRNLVEGQTLDMYPGKVFETKGAPGQSVYSIGFNNTAPSHIQMVDKAREFADEETGIFGYSYGSTAVNSAPRTASGTSMLMGASSLSIKSIVKNLDAHLLQPLGQAMFNWNMQFNSHDIDIRGDMKVIAKGTLAFMQKEVITQRLLSLIQVGSSPIMAPFLNAEYAFKELARNMDLDPEKMVNDPESAQLYAQLIGQMNVNQQQGPSQGASPANPGGNMGGPQPATGGINPGDNTGGGGSNIGVGSAPIPGEAQFSGGSQRS